MKSIFLAGGGKAEILRLLDARFAAALDPAKPVVYVPATPCVHGPTNPVSRGFARSWKRMAWLQ